MIAMRGAGIGLVLTSISVLTGGCIPGGSPRHSSDINPDIRSDPSDSPQRTTPIVAETHWQAQSIVPDAETIAASTYTVAPGDTLIAIGRQTGAGLNAIARANGLEPPYVIHPGQTLSIPGGRYHTVKRGETGIAIARAYGADWTSIVALNELEDPYILRVGQRVALPSEAEVSAMTREQRAQAFDLEIDDIITGGEPAIQENERPVAPVRSASISLPANAAVRSPANFEGRFGWPATGRIVTAFGESGSGQRNNGINIATPRGTPVLASAGGTVLYAGSDIRVHGGLVLISHGEGWITAYGHLEDLQVSRGQRVERGQMIARAGDTGQVDEPQLHFEILRNRRPVNPIGHLPDLT